MILAIETSCDDSSVALVDSDGVVVDLMSQNQDGLHAVFGGVVPEIAYRNHTVLLLPMIEKIIEKNNVIPNKLRGIAVTNRPGLMGSLLVGVVTAKSLAAAWDVPLFGVNHLHGHICAPFLREADSMPTFPLETPHLCLAVSGGHTSLYEVSQFPQVKVLLATRDDAAGECLDKFGKMLGLSFPGGPEVDRLAAQGDGSRFQFVESKFQSGVMSFSGIKSAAQRKVSALGELSDQDRQDLCASYQEEVCQQLLFHLRDVQQQTQLQHVTLTGGVCANTRLRSLFSEWTQELGLHGRLAQRRFCTDNAAMIGYAAHFSQRADMDLECSARSLSGDFVG